MGLPHKRAVAFFLGIVTLTPTLHQRAHWPALQRKLLKRDWLTRKKVLIP